MTVPGHNEVPVPSGHPDNDLLADLAAEVLPGDLALQVQHHVMTCGRCAALLADAESVRSLLLQIEPEVMPAEVLARLERSLATARQGDRPGATRSGNPIPDTGETVLISRVPGGEPPPAPPRKDAGRRIVRSGPATGRMAATGAGGPMTGRLNRMSQTTTSLRRQAIEEQKADEPSRLEKLAPILKIAAAVLVVAGVGVVGLQVLNRSGAGSADSGASTTASGSAPVLAPVQSTKTNYSKPAAETAAGQAELSGQVKKLITKSQALAAQPRSLAQSDAGGDTASKSSPEASTAARDAAEGTGAPNQLLRDPVALRACLKDIGAGNAQPVAVDLARYNNQEAAIIVLPADAGGGYEIWVVTRDCRPGSDSTIDVQTVKS